MIECILTDSVKCINPEQKQLVYNMSGLEMLHSTLAPMLKVVQIFNGSLKGLAIGSAEVD